MNSFSIGWIVALIGGPAAVAQGPGTGPVIPVRALRPIRPVTHTSIFRPYAQVSAVAESGPVYGREAGGAASILGTGVEAVVGAELHRLARRTVIGVEYRGEFRRYNVGAALDGSSHWLAASLTHRLTPRLELRLEQDAATLSRNFSLGAVGGIGSMLTGYFGNSFLATANELVETRTRFVSSGGDLIFRRSSRLSFQVGGSTFFVRRDRPDLFGADGTFARGDAAFRLSRRATIGVDYRFGVFRFSRQFGESYLHTLGINYALRLSRSWQIGWRAGGVRVESHTLTRVKIHPEVAAIIGFTEGIQAFHHTGYVPETIAYVLCARRRHKVEIAHSRSVGPGNGLFLTTRQDTSAGGYSYSPSPSWTVSVIGSRAVLRSWTAEPGKYTHTGAGIGVVRLLPGHCQFVLRIESRQYEFSPAGVRHLAYRASAGLVFSPGGST